MSPYRSIKGVEVKIREGLYAYYCIGPDAAIPPGNHFMVTKDTEETTIITKIPKYPKGNDVHSMTFVMLEVTTAKPSFDDVGFFAFLTRIIAKRGCNVSIVSGFTKDYLFIFEYEFSLILHAFKEKGVRITYE